MDPEVKHQLEEVRTLTKDNNRILRAIRRDQWLGFIGKIIIWVIILALPFYLYQKYLEPVISKFSETAGMTASGPLGLPTSAELEKLINSFKAGQ